MRGKKWSDGEIRTLMKYYPVSDINDLCKKLKGRNKSQIYSKANHLNLKKAETTQEDEDDGTFDHFERLNKNGRRFWRNYMDELGARFVDKVMLEDLCYWEQKKVKAREDLEKGKDVFVYRNKDGSVKHVQQSAFFQNLRNIQSEINLLRERLYKEVQEKKTKSLPDNVRPLRKTKSWV